MMLTEAELDFIEATRDRKAVTKYHLKKLQKIWNKLANKQDNYCMCSSTERRTYKKEFYEYYDSSQTS